MLTQAEREERAAMETPEEKRERLQLARREGMQSDDPQYGHDRMRDGARITITGKSDGSWLVEMVGGSFVVHSLSDAGVQIEHRWRQAEQAQ